MTRWTERGRRRPAALLLLVIGSLLAPLALAGVWVHSVLLSTDRYVAAVTPLITRAPVQDAVAASLTDRLLQQLDLSQRIYSVWPGAPDSLVNALSEQVDYYTALLSRQLVSSDMFVSVWSAANREAHASVVNLIDGEGPVAVSADGALLINLDTAAVELTRRIQEANIPLPDSLLPSFPTGQVAVLQVESLESLQPVLHGLDRARLLLPILAVLFLAGSVVVAAKRLQALAFAGAGLVVGMGALLIGLLLARPRYLAAAAQAAVPPEISEAMWDPLVESLSVTARLILILGVGLVLGASVAAVWRAR